MIHSRRLRRIARRWAGVALITAAGCSLAFCALTLAGRTSGEATLVSTAISAATPVAKFFPAARMRPVLRFPVLAPMHPDPLRVQALLAPIFADGVVAHAGIAVVAQDGAVLFGRNIARALAPASTMKLLVASSALNLLGPQYRFETEFVTEAPPKNGVITGPLWLVGSGDPLFSRDDLRAGVGVLARAGVRRITGEILVDDRAFTGLERNPKWNADDLQYGYAAGVSAISLDQGTVEFNIAPGLPGNSARVNVRPTNPDVRVRGGVQTVLPGDGTLVHIKLEPPPRGVFGPGNTFDINGRIELGQTQRFWEPVHNLARYAGFALFSGLKQRGIRVDGGVRIEPAPLVATTLWTHRSQPLEMILRDMLVVSNNHTAEQLLRVVGAQARHVGTLSTGAATERAELERLGIPMPGLHIVDGSGLSASNRIAALTLARLVAAELQTPDGERFLRGLPRVGLEGTVRYHQLHAALGRARAKSGHIEGVNALAGTVQTAAHGRVAFAIVVNDPGAYDGSVTIAQDRMLDALSRL